MKSALILGGTNFIGPYIIEALTEQGWRITLLHRGRTGPELFPDLEHVIGDRFDPATFAPLAERRFDAVIDTSASTAVALEAALDALEGRVGHYVFISSINAYADFIGPEIDEDYPRWATDELDPSSTEVTAETYGPLKALCEERLSERMPDQHAVLRPGLIGGPKDPTGRSLYWPVRFEEHDRVLAPGPPETPVQVIDARDLADFVALVCEEKLSGAYNTVGTSAPVTMRDLIALGASLSPNDAAPEWVSAAALEEAEVAPWVDLPCWVPATGEHEGLMRISSAKALEAGLVTRSFEQTWRDIITWWRGLEEPARQELYAGMSRERELELLDKLAAQPSK